VQVEVQVNQGCSGKRMAVVFRQDDSGAPAPGILSRRSQEEWLKLTPHHRGPIRLAPGGVLETSGSRTSSLDPKPDGPCSDRKFAIVSSERQIFEPVASQ
jgi:hypothetical protein